MELDYPCHIDNIPAAWNWTKTVYLWCLYFLNDPIIHAFRWTFQDCGKDGVEPPWNFKCHQLQQSEHMTGKQPVFVTTSFVIQFFYARSNKKCENGPNIFLRKSQYAII